MKKLISECSELICVLTTRESSDTDHANYYHQPYHISPPFPFDAVEKLLWYVNTYNNSLFVIDVMDER